MRIDYLSSDCTGLPVLPVGDAGRIVEVIDEPQVDGTLMAVPCGTILSSVISGSSSVACMGGCEPDVGSPLKDLAQTTALPFAFPVATPVTTRPR